MALRCPRITGSRRPLTFDGEGFAHRQQFAVGVNGDLVVQERLVHDEGVEFGRVAPAGLGEGVSIRLGLGVRPGAPPPAPASREHGDAVGRGGRTVAPHVRVHLWEALFDVGLRTALPHGAEAEALGRVVQLRASDWSALGRPCAPTQLCSGPPQPGPRMLNQRRHSTRLTWGRVILCGGPSCALLGPPPLQCQEHPQCDNHKCHQTWSMSPGDTLVLRTQTSISTHSWP